MRKESLFLDLKKAELGLDDIKKKIKYAVANVMSG